MEKLTLNNQMYIDLDNIIDIDSCPNVTNMVAQSFDHVRHNCNIRTFDLEGNQIKDTWYVSHVYDAKLDTNENIFKAEMTYGVRSPYYVLALREGGHNSYIYDSINTNEEVWKDIRWKPELKDIFAPLINYIEGLPFKHLGHCSFFINRPNVIPWYHVDSGEDQKLHTWKPQPHREEFIWINFGSDKTFYVLDDKIPVPIKSRSAFFNTCNYHGSHESTHSYTYSLRIEGVFLEELRQKMGIDHLERYYYENVSKST
tara:strand:+ start:910 stop:1680 length:771 start_codon:yes stop_codon:yes gene_type:complete